MGWSTHWSAERTVRASSRARWGSEPGPIPCGRQAHDASGIAANPATNTIVARVRRVFINPNSNTPIRRSPEQMLRVSAPLSSPRSGVVWAIADHRPPAPRQAALRPTGDTDRQHHGDDPNVSPTAALTATGSNRKRAPPGGCRRQASAGGRIAAEISPTTSASTISLATWIAFTIARSLDEPCEMMHTPSTPSNIAPPYVSGSSIS